MRFVVLLEIGQRLCDVGVLGVPEDVFHLRLTDGQLVTVDCTTGRVTAAVLRHDGRSD